MGFVIGDTQQECVKYTPSTAVWQAPRMAWNNVRYRWAYRIARAKSQAVRAGLTHGSTHTLWQVKEPVYIYVATRLTMQLALPSYWDWRYGLHWSGFLPHPCGRCGWPFNVLCPRSSDAHANAKPKFGREAEVSPPIFCLVLTLLVTSNPCFLFGVTGLQRGWYTCCSGCLWTEAPLNVVRIYMRLSSELLLQNLPANPWQRFFFYAMPVAT